MVTVSVKVDFRKNLWLAVCVGHDARPVHLIITMIKWIRNSRLSIKNSLSRARTASDDELAASSSPLPPSPPANCFTWLRVEGLGLTGLFFWVEVLGFRV